MTSDADPGQDQGQGQDQGHRRDQGQDQGQGQHEPHTGIVLPGHDVECSECEGTGRISLPIPAPYGGSRFKLERGWRKRYLIIELAKGEASRRSLARTLGVHSTAVDQFAARHAGEIADAQRTIEDRFVGLWITDKLKRLAEYEQDVDDANMMIGLGLEPAQPRDADPLDPATFAADQADDSTAPDVPNWMRIKHAALKAAAEELGDIPNRVRMDLTTTTVSYTLEGPDVTLDDV